MVSVQNGLSALMDFQDVDGMLPWAGPPFADEYQAVSFTYHLHTLIGVAYYFKYTGDLDYVKSHWDVYTKAIAWSLSSIDSSGLMNVTSGKVKMQHFYTSKAN